MSGNNKGITNLQGEGGGFQGESGVTPSPVNITSLHETQKCTVAGARDYLGAEKRRPAARGGKFVIQSRTDTSPSVESLARGITRIRRGSRTKQE